MSKSIPDSSYDAMLDEIATCTRVDITSDSSTPTDLLNTLANETLIAGDGNGDYTISDGDVSGRKLNFTAKADITVTGDGTAKHIVWSLAGTIKAITTCTDQVLTTGNTVTIPTIDLELADPT